MKEVFVPRPCQKVIRDHILNHNRCAVWAGTGFGKTGATLDALDTLDIVETGPSLVIAPPRVARSTWTDERDKWLNFEHRSISCCIGTPEQRSDALKRRADTYTISDTNLPWLMDRLKNDWPFKKVIWDEAAKLRGLRISEQTSKTGKVFYRAGGSKRLREFAKIAHTKVNHFVELTATPSPNGLKNLWGQGWMLDKGFRLGRTYDSFMTRWFKLSYDGYSVDPLPHAEKEIMGKMSDICKSLHPKDWFNIDEPIILPIYINLPPKVRYIYKDMEREMYVELKKNRGIEAFNAGSRIMKCRQIASGGLYHDLEFSDEGDKKAREWTYLHDEKIQALENIIEENDGMPIIIVYDFKFELERLKKTFPKGRHLATKKDEDDFKAGKINLLFMHLKSAGHGIDGFQYVTNIMVIMNPDWNLEDLDQGIGRIGPVRQFQAGFKRGTLIYPMIARGTVDEQILERWETKRSVQDILFDATKA
jgi:SNF2 family DNA or RNA helicase